MITLYFDREPTRPAFAAQTEMARRGLVSVAPIKVVRTGMAKGNRWYVQVSGEWVFAQDVGA